MTFRGAITASLLAGACLAAPAAFAREPAKTPEGEWSFETAKVNANCLLSGDISIWKARDGYACRFVATQSCTGSPPIEIKVAQSCTAKQTGDRVEIVSKIDRTVSVKPTDLKDAVDASYAADNFSVRLNKAGDEMTGKFHSLSEAFVRFRRHTNDLVS